MQEETLKLTFDLTVEVEQPIWINNHADRENYIEHYSDRYIWFSTFVLTYRYQFLIFRPTLRWFKVKVKRHLKLCIQHLFR